jgi:hypothetical protein
MRFSNTIVLGAALVFAGSFIATEGRAFVGGSGACVSAVKKSCGDVKPRVEPLRACFETHLDHLSERCASRLSHVADVAKQCEADVKRLCRGVTRVAELEDCMKPRLMEVSEPCKSALVKIAVPFSFFH